jgi:effector-binding domain-containing protein
LDRSIRLQVGVELHGPFVETADVVCSATPAGVVASAVHFGPYAGLGAAHDAIHAWCRANDTHRAGPSWEVYGHWQAEWNTNPSAIRTDVFYLLQNDSDR